MRLKSCGAIRTGAPRSHRGPNAFSIRSTGLLSGLITIGPSIPWSRMEPLDWIGEHLDSSKLMSRPSFAESLQLQTQAAAGSCRYEITTVSEIVRKAAGGELDIPAFQRGFVWTEAQLRDLAESLWRDYPIGMLLLWEPQIGESRRTKLLVADGQHRIISLCALFGQKPHWCAGNGNQSHAQMSIWFDPTAEKSGRFFVGGESPRSKGARRHLVSVPHLLALNIGRAEGQRQ